MKRKTTRYMSMLRRAQSEHRRAPLDDVADALSQSLFHERAVIIIDVEPDALIVTVWDQEGVNGPWSVRETASPPWPSIWTSLDLYRLFEVLILGWWDRIPTWATGCADALPGGAPLGGES